MGWWNEITAVEQVLYILAASSTIILLIQTVLSMVGLDSDMADLNGEEDLSGIALDSSGSSDSTPDEVCNEDGVEKQDDSSYSELVGLRIFTIRGVLSFFAIGSWVTIVLFKATASWPVSFCIGVVAGIITMLLIAKGFQLVMKLRFSEKVDLRNAIGTKGEVYFTIPPKGEGKGKVSVFVQERLRVYDAIAYEDKKIPTGKKVKILEVAGKNMLLVESEDEYPTQNE